MAFDVSALMQYKGWPLQKAANYVVMEKLVKMGGDAGLIAVDANGNIALPYNTPGMFRAYFKASGEKEIDMF